MKKLNLVIIALFFGGSVLVAQNREVRNVEDFNSVSFAFAGKLYLKQGSPQMVELEGDPDILKEIETKVSDGQLKIGRPGKWFDWSSSDNGKKVTVYVTVPNIEAVRVGGSGNVIGRSKIKTNELSLAVSGSGSISLDAEADGEVEADVSGSGNIELAGHFESFESDVSGSGRVRVSATIEDAARFDISGSGKIEASGSAETVEAKISGSGKVLAGALEANKCNVRITGSGDVEINVKNELDANIAGSGSVSYRGNPKKVNSHSAGSGKVRKI